MSLLPEVRGQLLNAAFPQGGTRRAATLRRWPGRLAIAAVGVAALAVAALALTNLHRSSTPPATPFVRPASGPPPRSWTSALLLAAQRANHNDPSCRATGPMHVSRVHFLDGAPPRQITRIIPSLGNAATGKRRVSTKELRALHIYANGIFRRYAWKGRADGVRFYIVPASIVGSNRPLTQHCYRQDVSAFRTVARRIPASQRSAALRYAKWAFSAKARAGVAIITIGPGVRGQTDVTAFTLAELATDPQDQNAGSGGNDHSTTSTLLVTDSVGSVTATYPAQKYPGRVPKTVSVTKRPVRNFVIFHLAGAWDPPRLTYRSKSGEIIGQTHSR